MQFEENPQNQLKQKKKNPRNQTQNLNQQKITWTTLNMQNSWNNSKNPEWLLGSVNSKLELNS